MRGITTNDLYLTEDQRCRMIMLVGALSKINDNEEIYLLQLEAFDIIESINHNTPNTKVSIDKTLIRKI